jgi:sugar lactone lactonase YvrE
MKYKTRFKRETPRITMSNANVCCIAIASLNMILAASWAIAQAEDPAKSGPAEDGQPAWFLQGSFPDPGGGTDVSADGTVTILPRSGFAQRNSLLGSCKDEVQSVCHGQAGMRAQGCLIDNRDKLTGECKARMDAYMTMQSGIAPCSHSPVCGNRMTDGIVGPQQGNGGGVPGGRLRVEWKQDPGYTYAYPYAAPAGPGGIPAVALDSKGNLVVFKRSPQGTPQLFEYGPDHKLIRTVGEEVLGHTNKAHGMAIDAQDNVWLCFNDLSVVKEVSPDGKLLKTIGESGHRGDWDEAKGQHLLWQPVMIAFAPNGDMYIGEGHANESPNDTDSPDPSNESGVARILHFDKNGKFVNQWYGNNMGPGHFYNSHALAIDPTNGDVWIGDREEYRIVVYTADGKFRKTLSMRNLVCALNFDHEGNPWMASGQDGQFLELNREGKVIGAVGNGMGIERGQFIEASYWVFDKNDNLYAGDTSVGRITEMIAPKKGAKAGE